MKKSPLAPTAFPALPSIAGVQLAAGEAGVKYHGRDDLLLAVMAPASSVAGVLTQSATAGAPVLWCRQRLMEESSGHEQEQGQEPRALLVNAGNANTFTGDAGEQHVLETCRAVAAAVGCRPERVLAASTGVIGEPLPVDKIIATIPSIANALDAGGSGTDLWQRCAAAITTTDTFPKGATARAQIDGQSVTINGIAKGSGMIEPNMATMLAFLFTDAAITPPVLQTLLARATENTFNAISVDGDASTSDICLAFATGKAGNPPAADADDPALGDFYTALENVMQDLALQVVRDGEGAEKLITVEVRGAENHRAANIIAKSIANSPLVKTAIAGEDANWGRVVMAVGNCGQRVDPASLSIAIGGVAVAENGAPVSGGPDETQLARHLAGREILLSVELGLGDGNARVWTCDLTHGYIEINAHYRT